MIIDFFKENFFQFIKFGIVGIFNTCNSLIIYYILIYLEINYLFANFFAYIFSCIITYSINKKFVFNSNNGSKIRHYIVYISSFFINMFCMYVWVDFLEISFYIAPILTLFVTVPYNYFFSKFWTFKKNSINNNFSHTFAICAYLECPYLEECILSLLNQTVSTNIIMITSTCNNFIKQMSKKYNIKLYIRKGKSDIQKDWNFAYCKADSDLVTIVHQDDIYESNYLENVLNFYNTYKNTLFICTDYFILKHGVKIKDINGILKRILKFPLRFSLFNGLRIFKILSLTFGNSINCPSVTYNKAKLGNNDIFTSNLKFSLDWDTFFKFARKNGRIGYIHKRLLCYRVHENATTVQFIKNNDRYKEDVIMFEKIWPKFMVRLIMKFYVKSSDIYKEFCK